MAKIAKTSIISTTYAQSSTALVSVDQALEEVASAADRLKDAYSKGTRRAYTASWHRFELWCAERSAVIASPAVATPENVVTYLEHRLKNGLSPRACVREYGALAAHLREIQPAGPWAPKILHPLIRKWLLAASKQARPAVKKEPLLPEHFVQLADLPSSNTLKELRDRAILLFGFAGGFRRSELVALNVEDVRFDGAGADALIVRSKTDQEGEGRHKAVARNSGRRCPVAALEKYMRLGSIVSGSIFRVIRSEKITEARLHDRAVALIVKNAVASLGLDPKKYAGHSLRCGFITAATERGATIEEIMNTTHHRRADQVIDYMRRATPFERNASRGLLDDKEAEIVPAPPEGFEQNLSAYGPRVCDMSCGETVGWGFRIVQRLSDERLAELRKYGDIHCFSAGDWALITRWLTYHEALGLYGHVTNVERGPRGGFRSITFGAKRFSHRRLYDEHQKQNGVTPPPPELVAACSRGHVHEAGKRAIGAFCTEGECALEAGKPLPERRIAWRTPSRAS